MAPEKTIWRLPEVISKTGLSKSTIYHKIAHEDFPPPIHISQNAVGWLAFEIYEWIQRRIDESRRGYQQ